MSALVLSGNSDASVGSMIQRNWINNLKLNYISVSVSHRLCHAVHHTYLERALFIVLLVRTMWFSCSHSHFQTGMTRDHSTPYILKRDSFFGFYLNQ